MAVSEQENLELNFSEVCSKVSEAINDVTAYKFFTPYRSKTDVLKAPICLVALPIAALAISALSLVVSLITAGASLLALPFAIGNLIFAKEENKLSTSAKITLICGAIAPIAAGFSVLMLAAAAIEPILRIFSLFTRPIATVCSAIKDAVGDDATSKTTFSAV
ncbi:MAG: hypothetical protein CMF38_04430 [Legionellaceae bacterium]|nr:hypothetical protein [Legionellaceae bacterium]HAF87867.1 hypothetical protein [Legionellales bacterium]HCA89948.1 hypothetical protein [Legionellales bacterium]|tara:strand:- start:2136 stop:2624 length:489 start_codon:yes stop_codon:yes gene_type:complete